MKNLSFNKKLEIEREKLDKLAVEALKKGIPLNQDEAFIAQNHKVDELVVRIQRDKLKNRKNQQVR
ncbi:MULTISPECIES: hypothetical protein [Thermotaleaceae]|uniref:Spo0E like sporulation regulatory protein n=1 Tax=Geosporobacter subterraneus DSM 17957 TaxID=1121919 RepID=A0A1M6HPW1_9FIRM|nr:hypothetical protein [Geosporobacter subterraneus]SHJ24240.1 hypothetical protein SAMN02745975_01593 [Geosporobacter subterraneus DSM 17957]